jgi:hypothetical protein
VVSVLATEPKCCGFKTLPRRWISKGDKNTQHTFLSNGKESGKVPCRKILRHVKELLKSTGMNRQNFLFPLSRPSPTSPEASGSQVRS